MNKVEEKLLQALNILSQLGMPEQQQNERTALCMLCLLDMTPEKSWSEAGSPLVGITPIMNWSREYYFKEYAPNTRETFRRYSIHQLLEAGVCLYNPDDPKRPVNSPKAVYQIEPTLLEVLKLYGTKAYDAAMSTYLQQNGSLAEAYAKKERW